ncbi:MAG: DUF1413 domain-containing protein [Lachnospiraceae bacterium]|nr:DUF1413 domain-containing protein [Lachnospiraceae bacterium]
MQKIPFEFTLQVKAELDAQTQEVNIISCVPVIVANKANLSPDIHTLSDTEHKYKILTLGAKFAKTYGMACGEEIRVYVNEELYPTPIISHKSTLGRLDGLTDFNKYFGIFLEEYERQFRNLGEINIGVYYDATQKELHITSSVQSIYIPKEAAKRAKEMFDKGEFFTLPDVYTTEEWKQLPYGTAGVIGKNFHNYVGAYCESIEFDKMIDIGNSSRAQYRIV